MAGLTAFETTATLGPVGRGGPRSAAPCRGGPHAAHADDAGLLVERLGVRIGQPSGPDGHDRLAPRSRRAMRANLRGLPKLSVYKRTTSVSGSSSQYCMRSLPLTSALSPSDTKLARPTPSREANSRMPVPKGPDCNEMDTDPRRTRVGARGAQRRVGRRREDAHARGPDDPQPVARALHQALAIGAPHRPAGGPSSDHQAPQVRGDGVVEHAVELVGGTATRARATSSGMSSRRG